MKTVRISLNSIDKVKSFVNDLAKFDVDFDLVSGRYVIDAKSIMGIFSLDLSKPIDLNIHSETQVDEILTVLASYIVQTYKLFDLYLFITSETAASASGMQRFFLHSIPILILTPNDFCSFNRFL